MEHTWPSRRWATLTQPKCLSISPALCARTTSRCLILPPQWKRIEPDLKPDIKSKAKHHERNNTNSSDDRTNSRCPSGRRQTTTRGCAPDLKQTELKQYGSGAGQTDDSCLTATGHQDR